MTFADPARRGLWVLGGLLVASKALGDPVDSSLFSAESVSHGVATPLTYLCTQAKVVKNHAAELEACRPSSKHRDALTQLAAEIDASTCVDPDQTPPDLERAQALVDATRLSLERVKAERAALDTAPQATAEAKKALDEAVSEKAADNAAASAELASARKANDHLIRFNDTLNRVLIDGASWEDFAAFKADGARQTKCQAFTSALYEDEAEDSDESNAAALASSTLAKDAASQAHATDLLRKGSNLSSALSSAAGIIEKPGAPDAVTASIMSALGADRATQGTQAVFTLNLAALFQPHRDERLKTAAAWRNLFLRASMPLDSVEGNNLSPAAAASEETDATEPPPDPAEPPETPDVTRFNFVLGTSLFDDTDPRLETPQKCFTSVVDYLPVASTERAETRVKPLREALFDGCAHEAAQAQRLAVRGALGLVTDEAEQKTNVELAAGAIVWGPTPYLYLNGIYQHVFRPDVVDTVGAGLSIGTNASASRSGVDAWGRITLDAFWLFSHVNDSWVMEGRLVPTAQFRMGDSIASLGVGPRLLGGDSDGVSLIATFAVTYDADALINPLLSPLHPATR
jgi:hypothetical protein